MYLDAYGVKEKKGFFPYEYIDSLDKLDETELPPQEAFYSQLKNEHISDEDYADCKKIWAEKGMTTLADFLEWYNNKDVGPFIKALENQSKFYEKELGIDMLKDGISVSGLALRYLFKNSIASYYGSIQIILKRQKQNMCVSFLKRFY